MKQSEKVLQTAGETTEYARQYINQQIEYYKLELAERLAKATASMVTIITVAVITTLVTVFLALAAGLYLGEQWGSYPLAFLGVSGILIAIGVIFYVLRRQIITNSVLSIIIRSFLE